MKKTGGQIELDVFNLLRDELKTIIRGDVYLQGTRPFDSHNEDVLVSFMTGRDADIQRGVVTITVFVPDIDFGGGKLVKDIARCNQLEAFMLDLVSHLKSEYKFSLERTIQSFPEPDIHQHFIDVKLDYKRFSVDYE